MLGVCLVLVGLAADIQTKHDLIMRMILYGLKCSCKLFSIVKIINIIRS